MSCFRCFTALSSITLIVAAVACSSDGDDSGGGGPSTGGGANNTGGAGIGGGADNTGGSNNTGGADNAGGTATGGADNTGGGAPDGSGGSDGTGGSDPGGGGVVPGTAGYDCSPASGSVPELKATPIIAGGLSEPIFLTHEPNGNANRLFVLTRAGTIRIIEDGSLVSTPFLDITSKAIAGSAAGDERGALGMAFHPDYETNGLFYVHYSDRSDPNDSGDTIIEEYKVSSNPDVADASSGRLVLHVEQPLHNPAIFKNHKGGSINFGADGFLYISLGDGGGSGDPQNYSQNLSSLLGKMLRINPVASGPDAYSIPAGNLRDTQGAAAPEIWAYGLRNAFRTSFDGCTGDHYIADVGQGAREEVNIEKPGEGGNNYGWRIMEGLQCHQPSSGCNQTGLTLPVLEYNRQAGQSITGGAVYRGSAIPALRGAYIYADYQSNGIWRTVYDRDAGTVSTPVSIRQDLNNLSSLVSITNGADGELYFVSLSGGVYKLEPAE